MALWNEHTLENAQNAFSKRSQNPFMTNSEERSTRSQNPLGRWYAVARAYGLDGSTQNTPLKSRPKSNILFKVNLLTSHKRSCKRELSRPLPGARNCNSKRPQLAARVRTRQMREPRQPTFEARCAPNTRIMELLQELQSVNSQPGRQRRVLTRAGNPSSTR